MKKFKDLIFEPHRLSVDYPDGMEDSMRYRNTVQARMKFDNGNTISVVGGGPLYGDGIETFEVMDHEGDVHGYLDKHGVTELMIKSQSMVQMGGVKIHKMI